MKKYLLILLTLVCIQASGQLIRGPYLQSATSTSIVLRWRTDIATDSRVRYGNSPGSLDKVIDDKDAVNEHEILIKGLAPETRYYYSFGSSTEIYQGNEDNYFETNPIVGKKGKYRFGVFGDCGTNSTMQANVRDQLIKYVGKDYLNAWLLLGDNAYNNGTDAEYQSNFFIHYKDNLLKNSPLFPAPGNHDYGNHPDRQNDHNIPYYDIFTVPTKGESGGLASENEAYYSFDYGNVHFLSLDSYGREDYSTRLYDTLGKQVKWIKADLAANKNKEWIVAYWHHAPVTMSTHNSDREEELIKLRENFIRILEREGVDLILCGHSHAYERSRLMRGHYDYSGTFDPATHNLSQSSAKYDGSENSCPYIKSSSNNEGTVYVVAGSSGQIGGTYPDFPLKSMYYSNANNGGALMLEVEGNRLDAKWIAADGQIRDNFTIEKDVNRHKTISVEQGEKVELAASFKGNFLWNTGETTKAITVTPKANIQYIVKDEFYCLADTFELKVASKPVVKLTSFTGSANTSNEVTLKWETESEPAFAHFSIERSLNGKDFVEISKENSGQKPGKLSYSFLDKTSKNITQTNDIFYRLKLVYQDGRTSYTSAIQVKIHVPVKLISFSASANNENVIDLQWETESELSFSYFRIERAVDGKNFKEIGQVESGQKAGQKQSYSFQDASVKETTENDKITYRLALVYLNQKVEYSKTIEVKIHVRLIINALSGNSDVNNIVRLNWETERELSVAHFLIEQSENAKDFKSVGKVNAVNKPGKNAYTYQDNSTTRFFNAEPLYYRLKVIYANGKFEYTSIMQINLKVIPPFNLISFEGFSDAENIVSLTWKTGSERKSAHFVVERSVDKKDFEEIGKKPASGNTTEIKTYEFTDIESGKIINEDTLHYRLKMIEISGKVTDSPILSVKLNHIILATDPATGIDIEIVPNPSSGEEVQIRLIGAENAVAELTLINISGKTIFSKTSKLSKTLSPFLPGGIAAGTYFIKVEVQGKTITRKFVIL